MLGLLLYAVSSIVRGWLRCIWRDVLGTWRVVNWSARCAGKKTEARAAKNLINNVNRKLVCRKLLQGCPNIIFGAVIGREE